MGRISTGGRIFGLDLMRAVGGIAVVLAHSGHLVGQHWPRFPAIPPIDWVNLFFLLSGFLIGGILLDATSAKGTPAFRCADFLQRRWLRSLPNYYVFLAFNVWLVHADLAPGMLSHAALGYAVFMQNMHVPLELFFWESWSLAVEEWFYLLFPLIVFGAMAMLAYSGQRAFLLACILFITLPIAARFAVAHHVHDAVTWAIWVKKLVMTRLDAPGMGMLAALIARRWPSAWRSVRWPTFILGTGLLLTVGTMRYDDAPRFAIYGLESAAAFSVALLLPLLSTWRSAGMLNDAMRHLSLITYALYLVHMPAIFLFGKYVPHPVPWVCAMRYVIFWAAILGVSALVFRLWERPFMRLRDPAGKWLERHWP
ncbi:MAG: acyltransferase [Flavobacteriales bacterium]|jgi:peptidoglycan/LPS O-acetylase OafA/YrhL|nr:acyltransferase [Flavobacteriales bacterium]MCB0757522.1 acyltransferase [Flavobacteriales bacterium]